MVLWWAAAAAMAARRSEPAAAAAYAGFIKQKQNLDSNSTCVILLTGNGLKDITSASKNLLMPDKTINSLNELN